MLFAMLKVIQSEKDLNALVELNTLQVAHNDIDVIPDLIGLEVKMISPLDRINITNSDINNLFYRSSPNYTLMETRG